MPRGAALINCLGRLIYSVERGRVDADNDAVVLVIAGSECNFVVSDSKNLFRRNEGGLHGQVSRSFEFEVTDIVDAIILKRLVDISICSEIRMIGHGEVCHSTYTNSFVFPQFTSNIEDHYFSKKGLHVAKVGSLSSYASIDFNCFDSLSNGAIKYILTDGGSPSGIAVEIDNSVSRHMSQMLSLFLCEGSRNPASFLTIPMCLEVGEYLHRLVVDDPDNVDEFKAKIDKIHSKSSNYLKLTEQIEELKAKAGADREISRFRREKDKQFIDLENLEDGSAIPKSKVMKDVMLCLFPLAIEKAVQGCRYINNKINKEVQETDCPLKNRLLHHYDESEGSIKEAVKILKIEWNLIEIYLEFLHRLKVGVELDKEKKIFTDLACEWFGIVDLDIPEGYDGELEIVEQALSIIGESAEEF